MSDDADEVELVVEIDDEEWIEDLETEFGPLSRAEKARLRQAKWEAASAEEWPRTLAVVLIVVGSLIGLWFGALLFAADDADILNSNLFSNSTEADVSGLIQSAQQENGSGGEPLEDVKVTLYRQGGTEVIKEAETSRDGRFFFGEVERVDMVIVIELDGHVTQRISFMPGDEAQLVFTLNEGAGTVEEDWRSESHLDDAVWLSTVIAGITIASALMGLLGAYEAKRAVHHRRTQILCFLCLFSRGGIFIGPALILMGMGLLSLTRRQFADWEPADEL